MPRKLVSLMLAPSWRSASSTLSSISSSTSSSTLSSLLWPLFLSSVCLSGCLAAPAEEAEHHTPAHRPVDFPAAVTRLDVLHAELLEGKKARPAGTIDALTELSDIVRWLPELAGDSDLDRVAWDRVAATTRLLEADLARVRSAPHERQSSKYAEAAALLEQHLRALRDLSETYQAQERRP